MWLNYFKYDWIFGRDKNDKELIKNLIKMHVE